MPAGPKKTVKQGRAGRARAAGKENARRKARPAAAGARVSARRRALRRELESLIAYIRSAKRDIAALCPDEIREKHLRPASDELDAVVAHTEEATGTILDAAEQVERIAGALAGGEARELTAAVTRIYEACNFQDITGQRIGKVVGTLKGIEAKIEALAAALGGRPAAAGGADRTAPAAAEDRLLHGPQLPASAKTQNEIDALLADSP